MSSRYNTEGRTPASASDAVPTVSLVFGTCRRRQPPLVNRQGWRSGNHGRRALGQRSGAAGQRTSGARWTPRLARRGVRLLAIPVRSPRQVDTTFRRCDEHTEDSLSAIPQAFGAHPVRWQSGCWAAHFRLRGRLGSGVKESLAIGNLLQFCEPALRPRRGPMPRRPDHASVNRARA